MDKHPEFPGFVEVGSVDVDAGANGRPRRVLIDFDPGHEAYEEITQEVAE